MTRGKTRARLAVLAVTLALAAGLSVAGTSVGGASAVHADTNDFTLDSFTADYELARAADGHATLRTVETIVAVFPETDQNRGIVRAIPEEYQRTDVDLTVVGVTDETGDPVPYETSSVDGFTELALGTDEFVHGRTTYVIEYTQRDVVGGFADTNAEEFYWDVNGTGWGQPFGSVTARLHLDPELTTALTGDLACYAGHYGSHDPCTVDTSADAAGTLLTATSVDLVPGENITIAVGFAPGTFTLPPSPEESWIVTVAPWIILGLAALLVGTLAVLRTFVWRDARGRGTIIVQYTPPEDMSVMLAAAMLGKKKVGLPAQVISFAVNRTARLVESPSEPTSRRYALEVLDPDRMSPADRHILTAFGAKLTTGGRVRLDTTDQKLGDRIERLHRAINDDVTQTGLRARGTSRLPGQLSLAGAVLLGAAWLVNWWAEQNEVSSTLVGWLIPGAVLALGLLLLQYRMPNRLTEKGALQRDYLLGLRDYLRLAEADRIRVLQSPEGAERMATLTPDLIVKLYEKLLPWAMLWGIERAWAEELGTLYDTTEATPDWYSGAGGTDDFNRKVSGFTRSLNRSSFARTPPKKTSSGSGSSWKGSGRSSSSGGSRGRGFSGGGGGGGGGRGR